MKRLLGISSLILVLIVISTTLYKTGKGYDVYITNSTNEGITPIDEVSIKIDGDTKVYNVKNDKKIVVMVKGSSHSFILNYTIDGEPKELSGKFKIESGKENIIDVANFINK